MKKAKDIVAPYLKEDGSLDVQQIDKLPLEEYTRVLGKLNDKQLKEYSSKTKQHLKEAHEPIRITKVNYTIEDLLKRGCVMADDFFNGLLEKH